MPTRLEGESGPTRFPRSPDQGARPRPRQRERAGRAAAALHSLLCRRVPGHRPAPGRNPACCSLPTIPRETDWHTARLVPGKLFLVGDPKQSIYRFRRADVALYEEVKESLLATGAELLHLTTSFRAPPSIQSFVNAAFASAMAAGPNGNQAAYVPLQPSRPEIIGRPTLIALPVPRPYGDFGKIVKWRIEESLPDAVGAFIDWLVNESGWTVEEDGKPVPVRPRHVCILFRQFRNFSTDVTRPYVRALEARRISHVLAGGRSFHDREEIIALRNALTAIEWPDDELRVFATLRGPFFALSDDALLAFRQYLDADGMLRTRRLHPMHAVDRDQLGPGGAGGRRRSRSPGAASYRAQSPPHRADDHHAARGGARSCRHRPLADWRASARQLLETGRSRAVLRARLQLHSGHSSNASKSDAERGDVGEAPILEEGTEGVRMMTVHKAKGLEFPVVILADPTCRAIWDKPSRHVVPARRLWLQPLCGCAPAELIDAAEEELRRDRAEAVRLAYVAATRARDLLIVPVVGDAPIAGWLDVLNPAIYPPEDARRRSSPAPGCPAFGDDSVLDRGLKGVPPSGGSVRPGLHPPKADGPESYGGIRQYCRSMWRSRSRSASSEFSRPDPDGTDLGCQRGKLCPLEICTRRGARRSIATLYFGPDGHLAFARGALGTRKSGWRLLRAPVPSALAGGALAR